MVKTIQKYVVSTFCFILVTSSLGQTGIKDNFELPEISWEEAGLNEDSINYLLDLIADSPPKDFRGLVVIKDNQLVIEAYFNTFWRNSISDIRSAGKSITAMLLGVALEEGLVQGLDQDVASFFPQEKYPFVNPDYQKIQLRHLLNMSSGLDADTDDNSTIGHVGNWIARENWKESILQVPLQDTPGEKWVYADIHAVLIGAVIEETSGMSLKDFANEKLFKPLGIQQFYWFTNSSNQTGAAGNLYLSALDFAKLGMVVLNEGRWKNQQIMDLDYTRELVTSKVFDISESFSLADSYGLMWYKARRTFGGREFEYLFASGNGGNHLVVIPQDRIVIALTSSAYGPGPGHRRSFNIMSKVLSALKP